MESCVPSGSSSAWPLAALFVSLAAWAMTQSRPLLRRMSSAIDLSLRAARIVIPLNTFVKAVNRSRSQRERRKHHDPLNIVALARDHNGAHRISHYCALGGSERTNYHVGADYGARDIGGFGGLAGDDLEVRMFGTDLCPVNERGQ